MTTIAQLPAAAAVAAGDLLPISQAGVTYSCTVAQVNAGLQTIITLPSGDLLGRNSVGAGGPEAVTVGTGLALSTGTLAANGADHAGFPVQASLSLADDVVVNAAAGPALLPVTALRGLFSGGSGIAIDQNGVVSTTVSAIAGPAGPQGPAGPAGPVGATGAQGVAGVGLTAPTSANVTGTVGSSDYVALWQNGALAWMSYGQFLGGQTIDQLPAAGPAGDDDEMIVAQAGNALSTQRFGSVWTYVQDKLPTVQAGVVELTANTVLDGTVHNNRLLVASVPITLTANFENTGSGFACTLINLSAGVVTMSTGISSGTGGTILPPGASTTLVGISYSGGSLIWWSGVVANAPTLTVGTIAAPLPNTAFTISGGLFNDAPTALDYSTNGGTSWVAASTPVISANAYSFTVPGLNPGTYTVQVRDHTNIAVLGVSNSFTVQAPAISMNTLPTEVTLNASLAVSGTVAPSSSAVQVGLSASGTVKPTVWVAATLSNGSWSATLTPAATGTVYVWAEQVSDIAVFAVSSAITVVAAGLTVSAPATGTAATALTVTGTVTPVTDAVSMVLDTQNSTAPTTGWVTATNSGGSLSASLTPSAGGTYYAWAKDTTSGLVAVSSVITVASGPSVTYGFNNPGGTYTHGTGTVPLNGAVTPAQVVATQVALSTSNTVVPTSGWQAASIIYSNSLWAIYYTTPATAGSYYVWVETAAGTNAAVSSFTVTVT